LLWEGLAAFCGRASAFVGGLVKVARYDEAYGSFSGACLGWSFFGGRLQEVLREHPLFFSTIVFKGCFSRSLDLFLVSSCFESKSDGLGVHSVVDGSMLESLSTSLAVAVGSMSLRKKKKGKFGISGLLRLLGQIQHKSD
jgi:hypothetical protein